MVVVDIGAYFGYYSLIAAQLVDKNGIVYTFEPEPNNYELLCKNIEANGYTNIIPIQKAVSNKHGKAKFWVDKFNLASASICEDNALPCPFYNVSKKVFVEVETMTLDEFFGNIKKNKVDLIKMDVGGAEGLIVEGANEILKNNNLKMFMEFWPDGLRAMGTNPLDLLQKLSKMQFNIKLINESRHILEEIEPVQFYKTVSESKSRHQEFNLLLEK